MIPLEIGTWLLIFATYLILFRELDKIQKQLKEKKEQ